MAGIGQLYSDPALRLAPERDYRYMANIVSSPIVDTPVSQAVSDVLSKRGQPHLFEAHTYEDLRPMFNQNETDTPGNPYILPQRNWCWIRSHKQSKGLFHQLCFD